MASGVGAGHPAGTVRKMFFIVYSAVLWGFLFIQIISNYELELKPRRSTQHFTMWWSCLPLELMLAAELHPWS